MGEPSGAVFECGLEAILRRGGARIAAVRGTDSGGCAFDLIEAVGQPDWELAEAPVDDAATFVSFQTFLDDYLAARRDWDALAHEDAADPRGPGYRDNLPARYEALLAKFRVAGEYYCACFGEDAAPCTIDDGAFDDGAFRSRAAG